MKKIILLFGAIAFFPLLAFAGACSCTDNTGNVIQSCFDDQNQCQDWCGNGSVNYDTEPCGNTFGFAGAQNLDKEEDLTNNCGNFTRVTVTPSKKDFADLCNTLGMKCVSVCDSNGNTKPCAGNPGYQDGRSVVTCK